MYIILYRSLTSLQACKQFSGYVSIIYGFTSVDTIGCEHFKDLVCTVEANKMYSV